MSSSQVGLEAPPSPRRQRERLVPSINDGGLRAALFVAASGLTAYLLIPDDVHPAGALFMPALLLTMGLVLNPLTEAWQAGSIQLFRTENTLQLGIIYWILLDLLQGLYPLTDVSREAVQSAFGVVVLFATAMGIGTLIAILPLPLAVRRLATTRATADEVFVAILLCAGLGMFYYFWSAGFSPVTVLEGLMRSRFATPWTRGALGGWSSFVEHLTYFGYLLPTLLVIFYLLSREGLSARMGFALLLTGLMILFVAQSGSRRTIGAALGAGILTWLWAVPRRLQFSKLLMAGVLTVGVLALLNYMLVVRGVGLQRSPSPTGLSKVIRVDDNFLRLAQVMELVPEKTPHVGFDWLIYTFVRPIPRVFWADKPTSPGFDLAQSLGERGVSLTYSVIGEWYVAFGWMGVLLGGLFYGMLARAWSQLLVGRFSPIGAATYAWGSMAMFVGLRSLIDLLLMSYVILVLLVLRSVIFGVLRPRELA